jgi:hypothetical protein
MLAAATAANDAPNRCSSTAAATAIAAGDLSSAASEKYLLEGLHSLLFR